MYMPQQKINMIHNVTLWVNRVVGHFPKYYMNILLENFNTKVEMHIYTPGAHGSVVVKALCCRPEGYGFKSWWGEFFLNWPNRSSHTGPGVDSASNRNEYQESIKIKKPG
jgi:hypothetical protein